MHFKHKTKNERARLKELHSIYKDMPEIERVIFCFLFNELEGGGMDVSSLYDLVSLLKYYKHKEFRTGLFELRKIGLITFFRHGGIMVVKINDEINEEGITGNGTHDSFSFAYYLENIEDEEFTFEKYR